MTNLFLSDEPYLDTDEWISKIGEGKTFSPTDLAFTDHYRYVGIHNTCCAGRPKTILTSEDEVNRLSDLDINSDKYKKKAFNCSTFAYYFLSYCDADLPIKKWHLLSIIALNIPMSMMAGFNGVSGYQFVLDFINQYVADGDLLVPNSLNEGLGALSIGVAGLHILMFIIKFLCDCCRRFDNLDSIDRHASSIIIQETPKLSSSIIFNLIQMLITGLNLYLEDEHFDNVLGAIANGALWSTLLYVSLISWGCVTATDFAFDDVNHIFKPGGMGRTIRLLIWSDKEVKFRKNELRKTEANNESQLEFLGAAV